VAFQADDGYRTEVRIGSIAADLDIAVNRVSGILYAPWFTQTVSGRVQNFDWWGMGGLDFVAEPDGGGFQVDVTPHDIVSGTELTLQYLEPDHDVVERSITAVEPSALGLKLGVNYGDDWVNGHCEAGHTIWITVTASDGSTVEATGVVTTGVVPGWDGGTGFEGNWIDWSTDPEIDPGDWVYARADNGEGKSVHVGTIRGQPNANDDDIQGTIDVPWLEDAVRVTCAGWGSAPGDAPRKQDLALPNNVDTYRCAWDPDTEWDLQPEQVIGVWYAEPDDDEVFAPFRIEETWQIFLPLVLRGS
jgi:hypothetical protein